MYQVAGGRVTYWLRRLSCSHCRFFQRQKKRAGENALRLVKAHIRCGGCLLLLCGHGIDEGEAVWGAIPGSVVPAVLDRE
jgi:hypothetical protein